METKGKFKKKRRGEGVELSQVGVVNEFNQVTWAWPRGTIKKKSSIKVKKWLSGNSRQKCVANENNNVK